GKPTFQGIVAAPGRTDDEVLRLAASLDQGSEHPLADAIVTEARQRGLPLASATDFESSTGIGVRGHVDGTPIAVGNAALMEQLGVDVRDLRTAAEDWRQRGASVVYVAAGNDLVGLVAIADPIKEATPKALQQLKTEGIRIIMATGDGLT